MLEEKIIISFFVVFLIQLLLCFKVKSRIIRFLPIIGFLLFGGYCVWGVVVTPPSWGRLSYWLIDVYCVIQIVLCGIAWGISAVVKHKQSEKI